VSGRRPYRIEVDDGVLDDLRNRLGRTRWTEQIDGAGWDYGADISYVRELCEYWRDGYDWRLHEARLNEHPQFICEVDGLDIHFQHVKGKGPNPLPLLLIHGTRN
jgi:microsomal epoxide hydrolase